MAQRNENLPREIPDELNKWNWGAFFLNWIWGIGNSTYIALLMFVPFVNLAMPFVLGAKGSRWAWENHYWRDASHFKTTQRNWAIAGGVVFVALILLILGLFYGLIALIKGSDVYQLAMARLRASPQVAQALGTPIAEGFMPLGSISVAGDGGKANLTISLSGPKAEGKARVLATKRGGVWTIHLLYVRVEGRPRPIVLINTKNIKTFTAQRDMSPRRDVRGRHARAWGAGGYSFPDDRRSLASAVGRGSRL